MPNNKRKPNKKQTQAQKTQKASKCMIIFLQSYYKVYFS